MFQWVGNRYVQALLQEETSCVHSINKYFLWKWYISESQKKVQYFSAYSLRQETNRTCKSVNTQTIRSYGCSKKVIFSGMYLMKPNEGSIQRWPKTEMKKLPVLNERKRAQRDWKGRDYWGEVSKVIVTHKLWPLYERPCFYVTDTVTHSFPGLVFFHWTSELFYQFKI